MSLPEGSAPTLLAVAECAADWLAWNDPALGPFVAVVAKIAFAFAPGETAALLPPVDLVVAERHRDRSPLRELEAASDAAPFLARPEILVVGHAYGPGGRATASMGIHVALGRQAVTFRKVLHVVGDREPGSHVPTPFRRMPLSWERALRTDANPVGVDPATCPPNLVDAVDPSLAAGTGPVAATWITRRARLGAARRSDLEAEPMMLPAGFDGTYFQAAPPDQWLDALHGDEWIALDGLHPSLPRLQTRLPGLRVGARFEGARGGRTVELRPDRLVLDTDRQRGTLTYRGSQPIDPTALGATRIFVGIAAPGAPVAWPLAAEPTARRPHVLGRPAAAAPAVLLDETTVAVATDEDAGVTQVASGGAPGPDRALPFAPARGDAAVRPDVPAALEDDDDETTAAGTAVVDVAALLARGGPLPFAGPQAQPAAVAPAPAVVPPPAVVPVHAVVVPQAAVPPPVVPPPLVGPPVRAAATLALEEETALEDVPSHPAEALPFLVAPAAPAVASSGVGGLPFAAPPAVAAAPTLAAPDPRGDTIPTLADGPFVVATVPWQIKPPKDSLTVLVKGSFTLTEGGPAVACDEPELPVGDVFAEDAPDGALLHASDFAILKPQCDVLVVGQAHAPGGSSRAMQIAVRVKGSGGRVDRQLTVFGDRTWQRALIAVAPTEPAVFEALPLTWQRAFGGPDLAANPHGVGYRARPGADGVLRLPNFEVPGHHIRSPDDVPPPACLAPIHPMWRARWGLLGTYDRAWFHERWPYFPKDFDYQYFQAAPPGQRLEKAIGDEEYELVGLVPGKPRVKGRLPGLKMRLFARKTAEAGGALTEIPVKLDTITFATEACRVDLVWRGWTEVSDDDAPEIERLFAIAEPVAGPPLSLDEVKRRYEAAVAPSPEVPPAAPPPPPPAAEDEPIDPAMLEAEALEAELAARTRHLDDELRAAGVADGGGTTPAPDPAALATSLRAAGATADDVAEVLAALEPPPADVVGAPGPAVDLRRLVEERIARREPLSGLDLRGADLRDLDLGGQVLKGSDLSHARLERARLGGADLEGALLVRASLDDASCREASLRGADLTDAGLEGADLTGASLDDATLSRVRASGANLRGASAVGATLVRATLTRARLEGAKLDGADLTGATLDDARFDGASMPKARLYDVRGRDASFVGCDMTNVRAEGAVLVHASFRGVVADDSVWERAELTTSTFQGASLVSASFVRATCLKTSFNEADLSTARLRKSRMTGATFVKANLFEASIERADLELADLRGANLHAATIWKTQLRHAKLDHAITSYSALGRKQP